MYRLFSIRLQTGALVVTGLLAFFAAPARAALPPNAATAVIAACGVAATEGVSIEPRGHDQVQVTCSSVERVANHAVRVRSDCRRVRGGWECRARSKHMQLELNGRTVAVEFPEPMNTWSAYQMVQAIGPMTVPKALPKPKDPRDRQDRCVLEGDDRDPQVARMTLRCAIWMVEFVKLCVEAGNCRYEPAIRRGADAPGVSGTESPERRRRRPDGPDNASH